MKVRLLALAACAVLCAAPFVYADPADTDDGMQMFAQNSMSGPMQADTSSMSGPSDNGSQTPADTSNGNDDMSADTATGDDDY